MQTAQFRKIVWNHYRRHGRDFPWRCTRNPYRILVSEIMLQQTQTERVLRFYPRFLQKFPTVQSLARASVSDVLTAWQGLGYNRRALALHKLSKVITSAYNGKIPKNYKKLLELSGVGSATAGGILAYAFGIGVPFIETNIRRVFIHHFFEKRENISDNEILSLVATTMSRANPREWYWALMDYGAHLAKKKSNPNRRSTRYRRQPRFKESNRELRAQLLKKILKEHSVSLPRLTAMLNKPSHRIQTAVKSLIHDGFIQLNDDLVKINGT